MNGIVDAYEFYFANLDSFHFDYNKRKYHNCLSCTGKLVGNYQICSREKTEKFIINYLEHLKVFGYSIKTANVFISSVRDNGILSPNVKGFWKLKQDDTHEVIVIEHVIVNDE